MSIKRVLVGAIAAIGAFLFLIVLTSVASFERSWLPYVAEPLGALIAGGALARQGSGHRFEAPAAGVLSVAMLAAVAFTSPNTFGWIAIRSAHPWPIALALALGCGAAAYAGARAAYGKGGLLSIIVLSTAVGSGMLLFGSRVVISIATHAFSIGSTGADVLLYACAVIAGFAVQAVVPLVNAGACASGVAILLAIRVVDESSRGHDIGGALWTVVFTLAAAFVGALIEQRVRPAA